MNAEYECRPCRAREDIIEKYKFVPLAPNAVTREYTIFPDGYFDLVFSFSENHGKVLLGGPFTRKAVVPLQDYELFIVRFRAGRLPGILDVKPPEVLDRMVEMPGIFGRHADSVCEMLQRQPGFAAKQHVMEGILAGLDLEPMLSKGVYCRAATVVDHFGGRLKVNELADKLGVTARTLERRFMDGLGNDAEALHPARPFPECRGKA